MSDCLMSPRKQMAMGTKPAMKMGGAVSGFLKSGKKDSPLETAKRNNGIPGFKAGGAMKGTKSKGVAAKGVKGMK